MNLTDATKGQDIVITLTDGTDIEGRFISVNSKGANIKTADGKVRSVAVKRIEMVRTPMTDHTPASLAELFGTSAFAVRVALRAAGKGVGKGRRYHLTDADVKALHTSMLEGAEA